MPLILILSLRMLLKSTGSISEDPGRKSRWFLTLRFLAESWGLPAPMRREVIRVGPDALADEATLANTIAHELSHGRDYLRSGIHKPHGDMSSVGDGTAYGAGNALEAFIRGER
ncbi:hypothetical protein [Corallococcus exercitus]|uniref:hypothetical protein n=1 Tax=Corallococcus exercitus TaxID=2316736 RepID=UPI0035D47657